MLVCMCVRVCDVTYQPATSQLLYSKKMNEHHKPSYMGEICHAARATPFTKEAPP